MLSGAYIVFPWNRAAPPSGTVDLSTYPQRLLISSASTIAWHSIGMEWNEHVAWLAPISITMAFSVISKYGRGIKKHPELRNKVLWFAVVSRFAAGIAGFFGAEIDVHGPVKGGSTFRLVQGDKP